MSDELKPLPCPFCGTAPLGPKKIVEDWAMWYWRIECVTCVTMDTMGSPEAAIASWNRRATPPASEQARDAERYRHILDCEVLAARTYVPDLDEADFKAKRRAANDRESAAMKAKP